LGIGDKPIRDKVADPYRLLRYVGLMTQRPRSGMGLELILRDALDGLSVSIIPCVERKARIPEDQRVFLGSTAHSLGTNTTIGEEVTDRMGKFRIRIGPLDTAAFRSFYPGEENYALTCFLTEYYTVEQLEYDIEVVLAEGEAKTVCLGDTDRSRLGLNTWIFSSDRIGEMRKVYSPAA
jgi:type VI secretion system protein ImpH